VVVANRFFVAVDHIKMQQILRDFRYELAADPDLHRAWHDNIAMFIHDRCDITDYELRNKLAREFMHYFFRTPK
jgi:hypothetical protein